VTSHDGVAAAGPVLASSHSVAVAHSVYSWLLLTQNWVYHQLRFTPVRSMVIADSRQPRSHEWDRVCTLESPWERLARWMSFTALGCALPLAPSKRA